MHKALLWMSFWLLWSTLGVQLALAQPQPDSTTATDEETIIDCKLPGEVRKLGGGRTHIMPGRVEKLSQAECELRGGSTN
jgi:hypothetical protein